MSQGPAGVAQADGLYSFYLALGFAGIRAIVVCARPLESALEEGRKDW
jgi:hypothetical protein